MQGALGFGFEVSGRYGVAAGIVGEYLRVVAGVPELSLNLVPKQNPHSKSQNLKPYASKPKKYCWFSTAISYIPLCPTNRQQEKTEAVRACASFSALETKVVAVLCTWKKGICT